MWCCTISAPMTKCMGEAVELEGAGLIGLRGEKTEVREVGREVVR